jgi:Trypsin-co-occurring domain 1
LTEVKIAVVPANEAEMVGGTRRRLEDFAARADDVGNALDAIARSLREKLDQLAEQQTAAWTLDQVTLGFSLEIQGTAGVVVIASASAKAGMQATITWKRKS